MPGGSSLSGSLQILVVCVIRRASGASKKKKKNTKERGLRRRDRWFVLVKHSVGKKMELEMETRGERAADVSK